jgi:hypothetical protein
MQIQPNPNSAIIVYWAIGFMAAAGASKRGSGSEFGPAGEFEGEGGQGEGWGRLRSAEAEVPTSTTGPAMLFMAPLDHISEYIFREKSRSRK